MKKKIAAFAVISITAFSGQAFAANEIVGVWEASDGASKIKISKCGSSFCNEIIWLDKPRKDTQNVDKSLRGRDLIGAQISNNLKPAGDKKWSGSVYSPKKGKIYNGFATISGNKLTMKGCLTSAGILCQKRTFKRSQ